MQPCYFQYPFAELVPEGNSRPVWTRDRAEAQLFTAPRRGASSQPRPATTRAPGDGHGARDVRSWVPGKSSAQLLDI